MFLLLFLSLVDSQGRDSTTVPNVNLKVFEEILKTVSIPC